MKLNVIVIMTAIIFIIFNSIAISAFPLRGLKKGDTVSIEQFVGLNKNIQELKQDSKVKVLLLWRNDKRTSVDTFKNFVSMCNEKGILCLAIDLKNGKLEDIEKLVKDVNENIVFGVDSKNITESWGIFTLPVTIFLGEKNEVIDAVGYEGQYVVSVGRYIDYLTGKITKEEYESFKGGKIDKSRSILPKLNFIKKLISENQVANAEIELEKIEKKDFPAELNPAELTIEERLRLIEIYLILNRLEDAEKVLNSISSQNIGAKFYRGYIDYQKGEFDSALNTLHSIENIYPKKEKLFFVLGKIYASKGSYKEASTYFEKACQVSLFE